MFPAPLGVQSRKHEPISQADYLSFVDALANDVLSGAEAQVVDVEERFDRWSKIVGVHGPDDQAGGLSAMYDLTFVNLRLLRAHLQTVL